MIALIDGDIVLYRSAASCEPTKIKEFLEPIEIGIERMVNLIHRIITETEAEDYKIFIGSDSNFRYLIYPEYKGNRKAPKPTYYQILRKYLIENYKTTVVEEIETDDILGIEQTTYGLESIICSIDKDLLQIPGYHYNFVRQLRSFVSPINGRRTFFRQVLTGDGSDNIPAFDGKLRNQVPIFIQKLLEPIDYMDNEWDMYQYCLQIYQDNLYGDDVKFDDAEKHLHRNAQLLYILRRKNEFWQPPVNNGPPLVSMPLLSPFSEMEHKDIHLNTNV